MKQKWALLAPYLALLAADFYLAPLWMKDSGGAMILMLCVMPFLAFAAALAHGMRRGFNPLLAGAALVLFAPTIWLYYNTTAWPYAPVYAALVLAGDGLGSLFHGKK